MLMLSTFVKQPLEIGECRNPLQEVEQNSRPDRDSGVNPGLNQTNIQPQAKPTVSFNVKAGENIPRNKPAVEKRPYNRILNWEKCPYCTFKPKTYHSYRNHVSSNCKNKPKRL